MALVYLLDYFEVSITALAILRHNGDNWKLQNLETMKLSYRM